MRRPLLFCALFVSLANEAGEVERSLPAALDVTPNGTAIYRHRLIGSFAQSLNLRAFPFDHDTFRVQIVALGYRPEEVQLIPERGRARPACERASARRKS